MINLKIKNWSTKWNAIDYDKFAALWPMADTTKPEKYPESSYTIPEGPCRVTNEEAMALVELGVQVEIVPYPGQMLVKMSDRSRWDHDIRPHDFAEGKAVQISVPDQALMYIDEVTHLDDCCTDELQGYLNEGWRILAVCPPNAQRRPDYIMGRRKKQDPFDGR